MKTYIMKLKNKIRGSFLVLVLLVIGCQKSKVENQITVADVTQKSDTVKNFSPIIQKMIGLAKAKNDQSVSLLLDKQDYYFHPEGAFVEELYISNHDQDNPKKVAFFLENMENVTIDGGGSTLIFRGTMIPFVLKNCKNVTLKNFVIDSDEPHLRQLRIDQVDVAKNTCIAEIQPNGKYRIEDGKLVIFGEDYQKVPNVAMAFSEDKRLAYNRPDVAFNPLKVTELKSNILKIEGWEQISKTTQGERFALRTYARPTPGIVIDHCKNTVVEQVKVHYANGMGLLAQLSENIHLNGFSVCLRDDKDPRYFTTQADATHFSGCKGIIRSENGLYEGMADDAINVHGTYLKVFERVNNQTLKVKYMHHQAWGFLWGKVGDTIQFVSSETMEIIGKTNTIKSIKAIDKPSEFGAKEFEVEFDADLHEDIKIENSVGIENLTWTPEVIFKNNIVRNNRARGALFSTPKKVICEENTFDHTHGTAILLCGDCNGWFETGACREVIIRKNKFINALTANYQFTNAVISIYPEIPQLAKQKQFFHSGITIEDNVFETFDKPILYAKSTENILFKNNKIIYNNDFKPFHWNQYPFFLERAKGVTLQQNDFGRPLTVEDIKVNLMPETEVKIQN
ncbi:alpha-1,3-galactosidase-related protein [Capnocytophaga canimorsus]